MSKDVLGVDSASFAAFMRGPIADLVGKSFGSDGPRFRWELKKFLKKQQCWTKGNAFLVDRSESFNPHASFEYDPGMKVWHGLSAGDGHAGVREEDLCSLALDSIDLDKVRLVNYAQRGQDLTYEDGYNKLKADRHIRLDAKIFETLWENQFLIPSAWEGRPHSEPLICFGGTVLRGHCGNRIMIAIRYRNFPRQMWEYVLLEMEKGMVDSAVFAVIEPK